MLAQKNAQDLALVLGSGKARTGTEGQRLEELHGAGIVKEKFGSRNRSRVGSESRKFSAHFRLSTRASGTAAATTSRASAARNWTPGERSTASRASSSTTVSR